MATSPIRDAGFGAQYARDQACVENAWLERKDSNLQPSDPE